MISQDSLFGRSKWTELAAKAGVHDTAAFRRCTHGAYALRQLAADSIDGAKLGVYATPTFLLNEELFVGAPRDLMKLVGRLERRHVDVRSPGVRR